MGFLFLLWSSFSLSTWRYLHLKKESYSLSFQRFSVFFHDCRDVIMVGSMRKKAAFPFFLISPQSWSSNYVLYFDHEGKAICHHNTWILGCQCLKNICFAQRSNTGLKPWSTSVGSSFGHRLPKILLFGHTANPCGWMNPNLNSFPARDAEFRAWSELISSWYTGRDRGT